MKFQFLHRLKLCKNRIIAISFLLVILFALCVYYNDNYETNAEYPSIKTILSNYPENEMVSVSGKVAGVYNGGFYLLDNYQGKEVIYKVDSSSKVDIRDYVSILGILGPSYNIKASKILVAKRWKEDFLLLRSAIGGLILLFIFWRFWKFDFKCMEYKRRK